uniref:Hydroxysteroid dehydrogenase like 1 n=1 Tax=Callorhinchus milii TaxID=7868 RepID=K4G0J7_CALMI|nr:hydroxysteroid dehydrogenase like 1 [Callorhinchus milii]|eukprot:gi/632963395/ref/XP_007897856.1/ PREDICTED: inactive hydroxysteroid dehydrogenase-like protein 1 [Callorhinchus milii]
MAAVDSFALLYRQITLISNSYFETLAFLGACYVTRTTINVVIDFYSLVRVHLIPHLSRRKDLIKCYGEWALVTGGTEGIGKAYAEELASQGINIILISHDYSKLEATAKRITEMFKVETITIETDFTKGQESYQPIKEVLKDKEIGILVNTANVVHKCPQPFLCLSKDQLCDILNVNIAAVNMMTHIVLPGMLKRQKGAIINISSGSYFIPTTHMAVYSSTKAYLDHFSRALHYEYSSKGIFVQSLMPFYVASDKSKSSWYLSWLFPSANVYSRHAISTLGISSRTPGYWVHSIQLIFTQWIPECLWIWGMNMMNKYK